MTPIEKKTLIDKIKSFGYTHDEYEQRWLRFYNWFDAQDELGFTISIADDFIEHTNIYLDYNSKFKTTETFKDINELLEFLENNN